MTRAGRALAQVAAWLAAALLITWPLAQEFGRALPAVYNGIDPLLQAYMIGWDRHAFTSGILGIFDAPIFFPERRTLTYMDHLIGEAALSWPVFLATGNAAIAYNSVILLSFVASAWAVYRLARQLGASRAAAFVAGLLFEIAPYRLCNISNLNQIQTQLVPLALWFALRFAARRRTRDLACAFGTLALQSYFGWYYAFHIAIVFAIVLACGHVFRWPGARPLPWRALGVSALLSLVVMLPGALPYWLQHITMKGFNRRLGTAGLYSADLLDHIRVNHENVLARIAHLPHGYVAYFIGFLTLALGVIGVIALRRDRSAGADPRGLPRYGAFLVVLAASGFLLSLGPVLRVAGHRLPIPLPYAVLYFIVPGFSGMRAAGRFAELVLLAAVLVAARGYDSLQSRVRQPSRRAALLASVSALAVVLAWSAPMPMVAYPERADMPAAYHYLARQPGAFAIVELPMPASEAVESERDAVRQIWGLYHGKARADGVSGFSPPSEETFRAQMQSFPDPESVRAVAERGIRYVVVRYGDYPPAEAARVRQQITGERALSEVFRSGTDVVYAVLQGDVLAATTR